MPDLVPHKWNSDHPETHPDNEVLDRKDFAARLAKEIRGWQKMESSLVLGLNGEWGSGKTTLANFVSHYIIEQCLGEGKPRPLIAHFNPWLWSGQDQLCRAFFDEITAALRGDGSIAKQNNGELADLIEQLKFATLAAGDVANKLQQSLTALFALLAGGSGVFSSYVESPGGKAFLSTSGLVLLTAAGACVAFAPFADNLASLLKLKSSSPSLPLESIRTELHSRFKKRSECMLVVIDDVDRLTKEQVRMLMQLVKANADFPNVVYLLLYQKDIVARALDDEAPGHGQDFLKKIVQVELEVPDAPEDKLRRMFRKQVEPTLFRDRSHFDEHRWDELFDEHAWPYFRTPRDIKRFSGTLAFYYESHVIDGELDVNPIDLFLLETLRMFEPEAYEAVGRAFQNQKSIVLGILFGDKESKKRLALSVKSLLEREDLAKDSQRQARLQAILYALIPQAQESFDPSDDRESAWNRDLRLCHSKHFAKYFQISRDAGDIPAAFISKLLKAGESREKLKTLLKKALNEWPFATLIDRLFAVRADIPQLEIDALVTALFDLSDELPGRDSMIDTPERALTRLVRALLMQVPDRIQREAILRHAISAEGISGPAMLLSSLEPPKDRVVEDAHLPISLPALQLLQKEFSPRIGEAAERGKFWALRIASFLIWRHREWLGEAATRKRLATAILTPETASVFLRKMLSESRIGGTKSVYTLAGTELESFVDLDELARSIRRLSPQPDDELTKAAIRALGNAIQRKQTNQPYGKIYVLSQDNKGNWVSEPEDALDW